MAAGSGETPGSGAGRGGQEYPGGAPAPVSGTYETLNLFGRRTGHRVAAQAGEALPPLPRGFTWMLLDGPGG